MLAQNKIEGPLRLFLIRHGETVDNIAGLYAGSRDSALTNHGVQQAQRLGRYFVESNVSFQRIFSSNLSRASRTANSIRQCQQDALANDHLRVLELPELREQDFGSYEGKSFYARTAESIDAGKDDPDYKDIESKESLSMRANKFINEHLLQAIEGGIDKEAQNIAVVSHGMLLSALWRCILRRQKPRTVTVDSELLANRAPISLEHLGGWSNTGYLELEIRRLDLHSVTETSHTPDSVVIPEQSPGVEDADLNPDVSERREANTAANSVANAGTSQLHETDLSACESDTVSPRPDYSLTVKAINSKVHLGGLKRGVDGSSKYDEGQTSISSFFKKQRMG